MITLLLYGFSAIGAAAALATVWLLTIMWWVARGSRDVNGEPERDAGKAVR